MPGRRLIGIWTPGRCSPTIVAKDESVQIDLKLIAAHTVVGSDQPAELHQFIAAPIPAARAHEAIRPTASGQIPLARFLAGKLRLKLGQGFRKWRARHSPILSLGAC